MRYKIIIVSIFTFLILGIIIVKNIPIQEKSQNLAFKTTILGCGNKNTKELTNLEKKVKKPTIEVTGNKVTYSRAINHLCCRKVELEKEIKNSTITILEKWSGPACKCLCFTKIEGRLENIPVGKYKVKVYEMGVDPEKERSLKRKELIISKNITIK